MAYFHNNLQEIQKSKLDLENKKILEKLEGLLKRKIPINEEIKDLGNISNKFKQFGVIICDKYIVSLCLKGIITPDLDSYDVEILFNDISVLIAKLGSLKILNISNNNLNSLPEIFENFTVLEILIASYNNFREFPEVICKLNSLTYLDLSHNIISSIPSSISNLKSLKVLNVSNNQINKIHSNLHACKKLEELKLLKNRINEIPVFFNKLINLKILNLSYNGIREINPGSIRNLNNLELLILSNNRIMEFPSQIPNFLANLESIKTFNLAKNLFNEKSIPDLLIRKIAEQFDDNYLELSEKSILAFFQVFVKISELNYIIEDKHIINLDLSFQELEFLPLNIGGLERLKELNLRGNKLKKLPPSFKNLRGLQVLNLSINPNIDIPDCIYSFENLFELNLSYCNIQRINQKIVNLNNLNYLNLSSNNIEKLHYSIKSLKKLKKLDISYNNLEEIPEFLFKLVKIEELDLSNNKITQIPDMISNLKELKLLNLNFNNIFKLPEEFSELINLETLTIVENNLNLLPQSIIKLENLQKLYLTNNNFNTIPKSLKELKNLKDLFISNNPLSNYFKNFLPDCNYEKSSILNQISIKNIYSFKETSFKDISQMALLVGTNNSGKSNFFKILLKIKPFANVNKNIIYSNSKSENAEIRYEFKFSNEFIYIFLEKIKQEFRFLRFINLDNALVKYRTIELSLFQFLRNFIIDIRFIEEKNDLSTYIAKMGFKVGGSCFNLIKYENKNNFKKSFRILRINWNLFERTTGIPKFNLSTITDTSKEIGQYFILGESKLIDESFNLQNPVIFLYLKELIKFFEKTTIVQEHRNFKMRADHYIDPKAKIQPNGSNFPQILAHFTDNLRPIQEFLLNLLRKFYPEINDLWSDSFERECRPFIQENNNKRYFDNVGKGLHQILVILTHLIQLEENETFLIEEPELFIHPQLQKMLFDITMKFLPYRQIFITTHSPFLLNLHGFDYSIHHIQKSFGSSKVKNVNKNEMVDVIHELGVNPSDILMYNGLILVEGKRDIKLIGTFLKSFLIENHIEIRKFEGKNKLHFIADHKILSNLMSKGFNFLIILDKDEGNKKIKNSIEDEQVRTNIMLLPVREIENLYLNPELIINFIENEYPEESKKIDLKNYINNIIKSVIEEQIKWETIIKEFIDEIPLKFSRKERESFLFEKEKEKWFDKFFKLSQNKFLVEKFNTESYISKFNKIEKKYNNINKDQWKIFPGKKIRPLIFKRIKDEKNINIPLEKLEILMKSNSFIQKELIKKIENHFKEHL